MHLRKLEVQGFKAFADRQTFELGTGMTVVAGPNGSGKSNVHDAIRWALGGVSRQIRARKTEDVIFSGSDQRRQLGTAEVTITLDNSEGWMPIDYSEVAVTRRAHRSGENEYLINGQKVRLVDVKDLFRRARVGQNSYAMMSQGLVDEVLAMRPQERRGLIEEAADVKGHREQLQLSERRLTETRDNLGRVRLLIREVEPRLRQLERQSKKAERHREIQRQLHDALRTYYEQELRKGAEAVTAARARNDQQTRAFQQADAALKGHGKRANELDGIVKQRTEALATLQAEERRLAEEGLRLNQEIALSEQRLELLVRRIEDIDGELEASDGHVPETVDETAERVEALILEAERARTALEDERQAMQATDERARLALRSIAEAEARRARLEAEREDAIRRIEEHERRFAELGTEQEAARSRRGELVDGLRDLGAHALDLQRRGRALDEAVAEAKRRRGQAEADLERQLRALTEARDGVRTAETRLRQLGERGEMLEQLAEQSDGGSAGSQALLDASHDDSTEDEPLTGVIGAVSRLISVPDGLEAAIETALAEQFAAIVVERADDAIAAIEYLRTNSAGTATLLPLESVDHNSPLNLFNERGVVGVAARLVRVDQRYRPLVDTLLGRTIVVENLDVARKMIERGLGSVVTRDGTLLRPNGAYYGGQGGGATQQFALQGEIEALPAQIVEAEATVASAREELAVAERTLTEAHAVVERARGGVDEATELSRSHDHQVAEFRRRQTTLSAEMGVVRATLAAASDAAAALTAGEARSEAEQGMEAVERDLTELRDRSDAVIAERDSGSEQITTAATALAAAVGAHRAAVEERERQTDAQRRGIERYERLRVEQVSSRKEIQDLELSLRGLREQTANNRSALTQAQDAIGPSHASLAESTEEQRELAAARGDRQGRLMAAERNALQAENDLNQSATALRALKRQLVDEGLRLGADGTVRAPPATEAAEVPREPASEFDDAEETGAETPQTVQLRGAAEIDPVMLRDRISELRGEQRALGAVNVEAVEDLSEERERHDYLVEQVDDLESAEVELRLAIRDLRKLIRDRFDETFKLVDVAFADYFTRFFGGGTANLTLVEPPEDDEDADPGVDITAQPPGKRIASLAVLSGGERALTSVALLFALLSVNPAPVCVLDEVDAALDEANVGRFADTLRELCDRSQFIVVSHSRRTIEAADAIYGISMGEDSVSRVLSMRLEDLPQAS